MFQEESMCDVDLLPERQTVIISTKFHKIPLGPYMELNDMFAIADLITPPARSTGQAFATGEKSFEKLSIDIRSQIARWSLWSACLCLSWMLRRSGGSDFLSHFSSRRFGQFVEIRFIGILIRNNECCAVRACYLGINMLRVVIAQS